MAGGMSFGAGFARGISGAVAAQSAREQRRKEREQEAKLRGLESMINEGSIEPGDIESAMSFIFGDKPDKKAKNAQGAVREILTKTLTPVQVGTSAPSDRLTGATPVGSPSRPPMPTNRGLPSGLVPTAFNPVQTTQSDPLASLAGATPQDPATKAALTGAAGNQREMLDPSGRGRRTAFGVPVLSQDETAVAKAGRAVMAEDAMLQARIKRAREVILPVLQSLNPKATLRDALIAAKVDVDRLTNTALMPRFAGNVEGAQLPEGTLDTNGDPINPNWRYRAENLPDGSRVYSPTEDRAVPAGTEFVQAAIDLKFSSVAEAINAGQGEALRKRADEIRRERAQTTAAGTAEGKYQGTRVDIPTSQSTGIPVGTANPQVESQTVPTMEQQAAGRTAAVLQADMNRLLGDGTAANPGLLNVLPSKTTMAGLAPGVTLAYLRRSKDFREDVAALESVVNGMVNDLARYKGQRGAQTEGDVERALSSLVQLQAGLADPFGGDTVESAKRRILEAKAGLDRVAAAMPKMPVVQPKPTNTPAAAPTNANTIPGWVMKDGKLYHNGTLVE